MAEESPEKQGAGSRHQQIAENRKRQEKKAKEARDKVTEAIKEKSLDLSDRANFVQGVLKEWLKLPINEAEEQWMAARKRFEEEMEANPDISLAEYIKRLTETTLPFEQKMDEAALIAKAYIQEMTKGSAQGRITAEVVMKMRDSVSAKAGLLAKLLSSPRNRDLVDALRWALEMGTKEGRSVDAGKPKALQTLERYLDQDPNYDKDETAFVWMILAFMDAKDRVAFAKDYVKKIPDSVKFLEVGNQNGVFGPDEMEEVSGQTFAPEKKVQYAQLWRSQNDFTKAAGNLMRSSYGAKNAAGEMLTLKNVLFFVAQLAAGVTIAGNVIAGIFKGGSLKKPGELVKNIAKNHNIWLASAVLGGIHLYKQKEPLGEFFAGKGERDTEAGRKAYTDLYKGTEGNPGWKEFFVKDSYSGAGVFWEFVLHSLKRNKRGERQNEIDMEKVTLAEFITWLDYKAEKSAQKALYAKLRDKIKGSKEKGYEIEGFPAQDYELKKFASAFYVLGIGGKQTKSEYEKAIAMAKGEISQPLPKTT